MSMFITEAGLSIWEHRRPNGTKVQVQLFGNLDAASPDDIVPYWGRTVHLSMQKKKKNYN
jgi:hypothetical protein